LGGGHELIIEEAGIGQEARVLGVEAHDVVGVAVADVGDVVDAVQHLAPVLLVEVLAPRVEQLQRAARIGQSHHRVQDLPPLGDYRIDLFCIFSIRKTLPSYSRPKPIELSSDYSFAGSRSGPGYAVGTWGFFEKYCRI